MTIKYEPKNVLRRMAPKKKIKKLVTQKLTVNKVVLNAIESSGILGKKELEKVALKVIKEYKKREKEERKAGANKSTAFENAVNDKKLMIQRVQNATVHEITRTVKKQYRGEFYEWLPSSAAEPDPEHMKNYGKIFQLGKGEAPGDRYGCQCGMRILVDESRLTLEE